MQAVRKNLASISIALQISIIRRQVILTFEEDGSQWIAMALSNQGIQVQEKGGLKRQTILWKNLGPESFEQVTAAFRQAIKF